MNAAELLTNALSADAAVREDATQKLEAASKDNYPAYMSMLASELANEASPSHIRNAAGLAVKNTLSARDFTRQEEYAQRWLTLPPEANADVKSKVMSTLRSQDARAGQVSAQVIAAIASIEMPKGLWANLIPELLLAMSDASNVRLRQSALQAIGFTCEATNAEMLTAQSNEILTAVIQGARKEESSQDVQLAALHALYNSLEFVRTNFEREGERNYIMQVVCEATQSANVAIKVAAYECLVRIMQLYYDKMQYYMQQALFGLTVLGMRDPEQTVALQAVEFWSTVCEEEIELGLEAEEAQEFGEEPERPCYNFARVALSEIFPVLLELLKQQDPDAEDDEWNIAKAAGVAIGLLSQCVADDIVPLAIPFVESNIKTADWRGREAALMSFGSILEGPAAATLRPLVEQALPTIMELLLQDESLQVKETASWTLGRVTDLMCEVIQPAILGNLIQAFITGLGAPQPQIPTNCAWGLMNLTEQLGAGTAPPEQVTTSAISPFFETIINSLLAATDRPTNEGNARTSAYEATATAVQSCPQDCLPQASTVVVSMLDRQAHLNQIANQLVGMDDRQNWSELQTNICSVLTSSVRRLGKEIGPMGDRMMTSLLTTIQNCGKQSEALEDAFMAVGAVCQALEADFEKYLEAFLPFLIEALRRHEETQLCKTAVGLVGDVCRSLGAGSVKYAQGFMGALVENLQAAQLGREVKPTILSAFGDIAVAVGAGFEPFLPTTMTVLQQATLSVGAVGTADLDSLDFINTLRLSLAEAYTGIIAGIRDTPDLLKPHVENIFAFIHLVSQVPVERTEELLRETLGLLGDLSAIFANGELKALLTQQWVAETIKAGRGRENGSETRRTAAWVREMVRKASA